MVDPIVVGPMLGWAAAKVADRLFDRVLDRVFDGPRTWQTPWRGGTDTIDITIGNHLRLQARTPVIVTLQEAGDPSGGAIVSLLLGDSTRLSVPRGDYVGSAMILDPSRGTGSDPLLRGFGWSRLQTGTSRLEIPAHAPNARLLSDVGLRRPDGTPLFRLPPTRRWTPPADRQIRTRSGLFIPDAGASARTRNPSACRALASLDRQCTNPPTTAKQLCPAHLRQLGHGLMVYDFQTGCPIR
ncbi:hypothetical protein AB0J55_22370 [Amycolatopsis sp. NPDC049688]|uniref:hypothetical protein n=1 Tax=Amycolatopsis sp. NPDC049688 TaxID=3154733 RepID=UPI003435F214